MFRECGISFVKFLVPYEGFLVSFFEMDDEILVQCSALKIIEEEGTVVVVDDAPMNASNPNMYFAVVGKVMTLRPYNFEAFKQTMNQIWAISKSALF